MMLSGKAKMDMSYGTVVPKILYGCKAWTIDEDVQ